jgi:hypothetical protein
MNKNVLIGGGIVLIILVGFIIFRMVGASSGSEEVVPTPTPTPVYKEVDESVKAELSLRPNGRFVDLTITGMDGRFSAIEYEVSYQTDKGPKGALSGARPLPLKSGQDTFEKEVELGTCSTGGKCTYDTGVRNFKLAVKFHTEDDEVFILKKEFDEL